MAMIKGVKKTPYKSKGSLIKKNSVKAGDEVQMLILCILPAVTNIHWLHLNADTYLEHYALDELYTSLHEELDCLAEQYIEHFGKLPSYEGHKYYEDSKELIMYIKEKVIVTYCDIRGINATIDNIHTALVKALYKLNLK